MRSVGVSSSVPLCKGSAEVNYHNRNELKKVRDDSVFNGQRLSEEDELRISEDVFNGSKRVELVKPRDIGQRQHLQAQSPLVQWERFLPLRSLKVLLVEDDDCTRHVVSALLRNCSYQVTAVANGLEAWKVIIDLNKQIDLVLTEVVMPYLSGVGLLTKIMNLVPRKNIPVIMMSSDDSMGIVFNCLSKGAVDFLVKPIRKNELKNLWQHVWRKCHSSSGSESESGIHAQKHTKVRNEVSDEVSDFSDEDDDTSIGLTAKDGSDNGSGNQSSWSKRAVEVESAKHVWDQLAGPHGSTCGQVIRPRPDTVNTRERIVENDKLDIVATGTDLETGVPRNSEKISDLNLKEVSEQRTVSTKNVMVSKESYKGSPALELSLKRPRDMEDTDTSTHKRNVVRQSDLSAFSRYNNATSNGNQAPTGNVGSCSPPDITISSKEPKPVNIESNSNEAPNHRSNGSSTHNNDMGSSTNNAFTEPDQLLADDKAIPPGPCEGDKAKFQVRHHHHHYHHHHHHVHKSQQQETANQDDGSSRNTMANVLAEQDEGNAANYGSASGSNNKSNGENNGSSGEKGDNGVAEKGETGNGSGTGGGRGSAVDQDRAAQREAALIKFRQKRKERCFEKKVRYQSRKKLAEQRPRVRGQFVRQGVDGKDAEL